MHSKKRNSNLNISGKILVITTILLVVNVFYGWWIQNNLNIDNTWIFILTLIPVNILSLKYFKDILKEKAMIPILLVIMYIGITLFWTPDFSRGLVILYGIYGMVSIGIVANKSGFYKQMLNTYANTVIISVILGVVLIHYISGIGFSLIMDYINSLGIYNNNELAFVCSVACIAVFYQHMKLIDKIIRIGIILVFIVALGSRGALFSLLLVILYIIVLKLERLEIFKVIPYAILVLSIGMLIYNGTIKNVELNIYQEETNLVQRYLKGISGDLNSRDYIWSLGFNSMYNEPIKCLFGFGVGSVDRKIAEGGYMEGSVKIDKNGVLRVHSHNAYLEYVMTSGLVSVLFAAVAIIAVFRKLDELDQINRTSMRNAFLILILLSSNAAVPFLNTIWPICGGMIIYFVLEKPQVNEAKIDKGCGEN